MVPGGENVGEPTLHRFFAVHVVVLPLLLMGLVGVHLYLVRRTGQGGQTRDEEDEELFHAGVGDENEGPEAV